MQLQTSASPVAPGLLLQPQQFPVPEGKLGFFLAFAELARPYGRLNDPGFMVWGLCVGPMVKLKWNKEELEDS